MGSSPFAHIQGLITPPLHDTTAVIVLEENHMRIALIGEYSQEVAAHRAIDRALELAAEALNVEIEPIWMSTIELPSSEKLTSMDGGWLVPASPYASFENALGAVRYFRETGKPFLGTCGGFQHAVVEYARNVLGHRDAGITEIDPDCKMPLVSALECRLVDEALFVFPVRGELIHGLVGDEPMEVIYRCGFGLNPEFAHVFDKSALQPAALNQEGAVQAMALAEHPFFLGCAFQPERAALHGDVHPIVHGFVTAVKASCRVPS